MSHLFTPSPTVRVHTEITPSLFCLHRCPSGGVWGWAYYHCLCDHSHLLPAVRYLRLYPKYVVLRTSVSLLCHPNCVTSDPSNRLWNFSPLCCYNLQPCILTCIVWGIGCSPLVSDCGGMCVSKSSRMCSFLWSENLCSIIFRLLPLGTWCRTCLSHRITPCICKLP